MKHIRTILSIVLILVILNGCGNQKTQTNDSQTNSIDAIESNANDKVNTNNDTKNDNSTKQNDTLQTQNNIDKNKINLTDDSTKTSESKTSNSDSTIKENVIDYIINGQENKSESQKLKWSKTFLNKIDIDSLFKQYTENKGNADDIEGFATYITKNAPVLSNWQDLFKKDLYDTYGENVVKIKHLENDLYQAYIEKDGLQVPYVVVSSKTGYFHG
ncbi:hypothetical protein [Clostridium sp. YIM B02555]|uniref:hypothetical protein n=1 Tax=Clostridium sp. YIM B02555 TaxID=2911968 RepID=UPI001EEDAE00|nr:hypothetical protein [Clostridium sp. YIM B02555]